MPIAPMPLGNAGTKPSVETLGSYNFAAQRDGEEVRGNAGGVDMPDYIADGAHTDARGREPGEKDAGHEGQDVMNLIPENSLRQYFMQQDQLRATPEATRPAPDPWSRGSAATRPAPGHSAYTPGSKPGAKVHKLPPLSSMAEPSSRWPPSQGAVTPSPWDTGAGPSAASPYGNLQQRPNTSKGRRPKPADSTKPPAGALRPASASVLKRSEAVGGAKEMEESTPNPVSSSAGSEAGGLNGTPDQGAGALATMNVSASMPTLQRLQASQQQQALAQQEDLRPDREQHLVTPSSYGTSGRGKLRPKVAARSPQATPPQGHDYKLNPLANDAERARYQRVQQKLEHERQEGRKKLSDPDKSTSKDAQTGKGTKEIVNDKRGEAAVPTQQPDPMRMVDPFTAHAAAQAAAPASRPRPTRPKSAKRGGKRTAPGPAPTSWQEWQAQGAQRQAQSRSSTLSGSGALQRPLGETTKLNDSTRLLTPQEPKQPMHDSELFKQLLV